MSLSRWMVGLLAAALLLSLGVRLVYAHASYDRSEPADGAVLESSPPRADVWFKQEVQRRGEETTMMVVNQNGDRVDTSVVIDDADRRHMYAELPPALPPGRYTVIWSTLSAEDGEKAHGAFHFFVGTGAATASPTTTATPAATTPSPAAMATVAASPTPPSDGAASSAEGSGVPVWALVIGVLGGVAAGGAAGLGLGRMGRR